jgi:hypothetical protein
MNGLANRFTNRFAIGPRRATATRRISAAQSSWRTRFVIALCALALTSLCGCITYEVEGESSGSMKKKVQEFFAYKNARMFYPNGVTGSPEELPELDGKAVKAIEVTYQAMLEASIVSHARQNSQLSAMFERPLPDEVKASVVVVDAPLVRGQPLARMEADGTLVMSTKVAQAMFRTAILRGMQSTDLGGVRFMDGDIRRFGERADDEREMIGQFNRLIDEVSAARGRSVVGDLISEMRDDDMQGSWSRMNDFAQMSAEVENAYRAPIRFLIAHELGHLVLGHFSSHPIASTVVDQDLCRRQETEADVYAIALISTMPEYRKLLDQGGLGLEDTLFGGSLFLYGHREFFESTYDLARFAPPAGAAAESQCRYETPQERYAFLEKVKDTIIDAGRNPTMTELLALKPALRTSSTEGTP